MQDKAKIPFVSIVIPCRNESKHIGRVLGRFACQSFEGQIEVVVVDGLSEDGTRNLVQAFGKNHPELNVKLLTNEKRNIPSSLNKGIRAARGEVIIRMDGHSLPDTHYVQSAVDTMMQNDFDIVGGICRTNPSSDTKVAKLIAVALSHPFGVGDSRFRLVGSNPHGRLVDTVPFGCFKKTLWEELGGYDETQLINEDYDFNYRARKRGGKVYLNPGMVTDYFARDTLKGLVKQFFQYGRWKYKMLERHPKSIKLRHFIPPVFVFSFFVLAIGSIFSSVLLKIWLCEALIYLLTSLISTIHVSKLHRLSRGIIMLPFVFLFMHFSWGLGVLESASLGKLFKNR